MIVPGPQICCRYEMCTARPWNEHSPCKLRSREIGEKAKQNSARNYAKCSKCFQFLCNNSDRTWIFNALTFARSLGRCCKPRPEASVFNTSLGTWRILMHEKPCLIPILKNESAMWDNVPYDVHPVKIQTSLSIRAIWMLKNSLRLGRVPGLDFDQTGWTGWSESSLGALVQRYIYPPLKLIWY